MQQECIALSQTLALLTGKASSPLFFTLTVVDGCSSSQDIPQFDSTTRAKRISAGPIPLNRMEVAVHKQSEQYLDSYASMDGQLYDKPQGFAIDANVARGQENKDHGGGMV